MPTDKPNGPSLSGNISFSHDEIAHLVTAGILPADHPTTWEDVSGAIWDLLEAHWFKPDPNHDPEPPLPELPV